MTHSQKSDHLEKISLATQILCFSIFTPLVEPWLFARLKLRNRFGVEDGMCPSISLVSLLILEATCYIQLLFCGSFHLHLVLYGSSIKLAQQGLLIHLLIRHIHRRHSHLTTLKDTIWEPNTEYLSPSPLSNVA